MRWISRAIGWLGDYQAVSTVLQSELFRVYFWPTVYAVLTGGAGIWGEIPFMWVLMAAALAFGGTASGILRLSEYRERKDPESKLKYIGTFVRIDRAAQGNTFSAAQIVVLLRNEASFPISVIISNASTEVDGRTPPRTSFPKPAMSMPSGSNLQCVDDPIDMGVRTFGDLRGKMDFRIMYGLKGRENYLLHLRGDIHAAMDEAGIVREIVTAWN